MLDKAETKTAVVYDEFLPASHLIRLYKLGRNVSVMVGKQSVVVAPQVLIAALQQLVGQDTTTELLNYCERLECELAACECRNARD